MLASYLEFDEWSSLHLYVYICMHQGWNQVGSSRPSGSDLLYKISGSDPDSTLYHMRWWWCLALVTMEVYFPILLKVFLKLVIDSNYILNKKKETKGSRAWQQFWTMFNPVNNEEVFRVMCYCVCKVCILYKKGVKREERSLGKK